MPRFPRFVLPGFPHHVTHRGNNRQRVFFSDRDYQNYLDSLFRLAQDRKVRLLAYCLMPNHIHAICVPSHRDSLTRLFRELHSQFARSSNRARQCCGHLWQERFYSCVMDHQHNYQAMAYIEKNPVRAGLTTQAGDWQWSSARVHLGEIRPPGTMDLDEWNEFYQPDQWRVVLEKSIHQEAWIRRFRYSSLRGYPLANEQFVEKLEQLSGKTLRPGKRGRQPGSQPQRLKSAPATAVELLGTGASSA